MRLYFTIVFLLYSSVSLVFGQEEVSKTRLAGLCVKVAEAGNGSPIQMASVYIVPTRDTVVSAFTFTDKKGIATLSNIPAGKYVVNVQMLGFKPHSQEIILNERTQHSLSVSMEEAITELDGAIITEMGDLVTTKGDTLIYNATSFRTATNANLGDLLRKMPGIEVGNGAVKVNGDVVTTITVEGKTFFSGDISKTLDNLPAFIVNKVKVIEEENRDRFGLNKKKKKIDIRLKDEYHDGWFGKVSVDGGASIKDKSPNNLSDPSHALYNAKLYSSYYGESDQFTLLGGGNNVNPSQLTQKASGLSNTASVGVNYNTSRIPDIGVVASTSYDFKDNDDYSSSQRISFLTSGEQLLTDRYQSKNNINNSTKVHLGIGNSLERRESNGYHIGVDFHYNKRRATNESFSSTSNSVTEINNSESLTSGNYDDFAIDVDIKTQYFLDKGNIHHLSFRGDIKYNDSQGKSEEYSLTHLTDSTEVRSLLYDEKCNGLLINGTLSYSAMCSSHWEISTSASVDYYSSKNVRNADNAGDHSRNEYYSKNTDDKIIDLTESIVIKYGRNNGGTKLFNTSLGLCIYENIISNNSIQNAKEHKNRSCNINAGPVASLSFNDFKNSYTISTRGESITPSRGSDLNPTLDISDPVNVSTGNIYLKSGYRQNLVLQMRLRSEKLRKAVIAMTLKGSACMNEVTCASWFDSSAVRYSIPVNSKCPHFNAGLNISYVQPLNKTKSLNMTITPKVSFINTTHYVSNKPLRSLDKETFDYSEMMKWFYGDSEGSEFYSGKSGFIENRSFKTNWSIKADLKYEILAYSIRCGGSVENTMNNYSAYPTSKVNNWCINAFAELLWLNKTGWEIETRFDFNGYKGFSDNYNNPEYLLKIRLAKTIKSFTISLSGYDILGSAKSFHHTSSAEYVEDIYHNNIGRSILLGLSFNFGKWDRSVKLKQQQMEKNRNL